ncbi:MAG: hypothetical protein EA371_05315 [Gammaproteobacteria bacterium]|nr:MAG: hypothetical protein EA371_05315 [Gammaproteobacteria bacterium]
MPPPNLTLGIARLPMRPPAMRFAAVTVLLLALLAAGPDIASAEPPIYDLHYHARLDPDSGEAHVRIQLTQSQHALREARFNIDEDRHHGFDGDGELVAGDGVVYWRPPAQGGEFRLRVRVDRQRGTGSYDARITPEWALLRADHLFPAARTRSLAGAHARATVSFELPASWSLESRYGPWRGEPLVVEDPERRFIRPTGWLLAGDLGVRRDRVAGRELVVAAPVGEGARRMDALALLRWTLPALLEIFPDFPERLLVVSAGDPMWRGGLSGPESLYLHADRPMINERGTSTLLHELVHVAGIVQPGPGAGWIVEGLADYYSLEVLHRAGVISDRRHRLSLETLTRRAEGVRRLDTRDAGGAVTARAVIELSRIDAAIREASEEHYSLDDVARQLAEAREPITYARLRRLSESLAGQPLPVFDELPLSRRR